MGASARVTFVQPDSNSIALNWMNSASPSQISGLPSANGQVLLVNPNGIVFGAGSQIRAVVLMASVFDISDADLSAGHSQRSHPWIDPEPDEAGQQLYRLGYQCGCAGYQ